LLVIADNKILVIDYKLQNIDEEAYESQLKGYFSYLKPRVDKPIYLYLYSLNEKRLKAIE
jgi:ATP-dependent exoDNAse (exonuclease V) beta subunit